MPVWKRQNVAINRQCTFAGSTVMKRGMRILRERTEDLWLPLLNRLRVPIEQALRDARLKPSQIDSLVLVGGASQMPLVQRIAVRLFGKLPYQSYDPSTIVALGAAIRAACRLRSEDIEEVILTDICPYSLGVEVNRRGRFRHFLADY